MAFFVCLRVCCLFVHHLLPFCFDKGHSTNAKHIYNSHAEPYNVYAYGFPFGDLIESI